jgi:hypothetical protein
VLADFGAGDIIVPLTGLSCHTTSDMGSALFQGFPGRSRGIKGQLAIPVPTAVAMFDMRRFKCRGPGRGLRPAHAFKVGYAI